MTKKRKSSLNENGVYIEPSEYIPKEIRRELKLGEYDDEYDEENENDDNK